MSIIGLFDVTVNVSTSWLGEKNSADDTLFLQGDWIGIKVCTVGMGRSTSFKCHVIVLASAVVKEDT